MVKPDAKPESDKISHKLQALLAAQTLLKGEIQYRSDFQHRFLQFYITTLVVMISAIGGGLSAAALPASTQTDASTQALEQLAPWLILLTPFITSLFALWYFDHAATIEELGEYIQAKIEPRIAELVDENFSWESDFELGTLSRRFSYFNFRVILFLTFILPSLATISGSLALLILTSIYGSRSDAEWWIATACITLNIVVVSQTFLAWNNRRLKSNARKRWSRINKLRKNVDPVIFEQNISTLMSQINPATPLDAEILRNLAIEQWYKTKLLEQQNLAAKRGTK